MNVLANHTKLFNAYIAIDPSMWYDKERFLKATEEKLVQKKYDGIKLYVGIANNAPGNDCCKNAERHCCQHKAYPLHF